MPLVPCSPQLGKNIYLFKNASCERSQRAMLLQLLAGFLRTHDEGLHDGLHVHFVGTPLLPPASSELYLHECGVDKGVRPPQQLSRGE